MNLYWPENDPLICAPCKRKFTDRKARANHDKVAHEPAECPECGNIVPSINLASHMARRHSTEEFNCSYCDESYESRSDRTTHTKRSHKGEAGFKCDNCSERFQQFESLKRHLLTHMLQPRHQCDLCSDTFQTLGPYGEYGATSSNTELLD